MMTITCKIDRRASLVAGISTDSDILQIEVDPAQMTPEDRVILAGRLNGQMEVCSRHREDGRYYRAGGYPYDAPHENCDMVTVTAPTLGAVLDAIRSENRAVADEAVRQVEEQARHLEAVREATLAVVRERKTRDQYTCVRVVREETGDITDVVSDYLSDHDWPAQVFISYRRPAWPREADQEVMESEATLAWLRDLDAEKESAIAEAKATAIEKLLEIEAAKKAKEEEESRAVAEREAWIREHGSERLLRMLEEGIEFEKTYLDERLAIERPEWRYVVDCDRDYDEDEPKNIPQAALELLDEARKKDPNTKLALWEIESEDDDGDASWRGHVCKSTFLGEDIVFGVPSEYFSE